MAETESGIPGVYIDLDDLIALEYRGRKVSFLPRQPVHSLLSGRFASRMREAKRPDNRLCTGWRGRNETSRPRYSSAIRSSRSM